MLNFPSLLQKLPQSAVFQTHSDLWVKRDDLIHPIISGNKARKLQAFLMAIEVNKPSAILSMGGNRSNFLHALAYICYSRGIACHALIRGHQPKVFDRTLRDLESWGTHLSFIDKDTFVQLRDKPELALQKADKLDAVWLPEGGSNADALHGIIKAVDELGFAPDEIFVPVGTGCTALGLALGCQQRGWNTKVIAVVVLKGAEAIKDSIAELATEAGYNLPDNLVLEHNFCGAGFGKVTADIKQQQIDYEKALGLPLEPVYSVKMVNALAHYCKNNLVGKRVVMWHTGGLQGNATN